MNRRFFLGLVAAGFVAVASRTRLAESALVATEPAGGQSALIIEGFELGVETDETVHWMQLVYNEIRECLEFEAGLSEVNGFWKSVHVRGPGISDSKPADVGVKVNTQSWLLSISDDNLDEFDTRLFAHLNARNLLSEVA